MIPYWKKGCRYLLRNDPVFKKYYNPDHFLKLNHNKFDVLFKSICSQQISVSAAMSIYKKTKKIIGNVNFKNFKDKADMIDDLPITLNKKKCILSLIENYQMVNSIKKDITFLNSPPYELTKIFGIGPWTVEMFGIFHLGISNILPKGDLGLINAYKKNYQDENLLYFDSNSKIWGNYSTIVTWYLWSSYDDEPLYL